MGRMQPIKNFEILKEQGPPSQRLPATDMGMGRATTYHEWVVCTVKWMV